MKAQLIVTAHTEDAQKDAILVLRENEHFELDAPDVMVVGEESVDGFYLFDDASDIVEDFFNEKTVARFAAANREAVCGWVKELGHPDGYAAPMGHRGDEWGFVFIPRETT
tara:strand:- start:1008 stop:1340 length:333 start_codon:yes stop_codon:yes gene_type:complete